VVGDETERAGEGDRVDLVLQVAGAEGLEPDELASLTEQLREELLDLDVDDVRPVSGGAAPEGSKAIELAALGALIVRLATSPKALLGVVRTVSGWLQRSGARSVHVQIGDDVLEVTGISSEDQHALIDAWIERHTPSSSST
jgi:hypothetical protein